MTIEVYRDILGPFKDDPRSSAVFSDIDGTISKIARRPDLADVPEDAKRAIAGLIEKCALVCLVTGRDFSWIKEHVWIEGAAYVASHGLEIYAEGELSYVPGAEPYLKTIPEVAEALTSELSSDGVLVEKKALTVAAHYRGASDPDKTRERILKIAGALSARYALKTMAARLAVELRPAIEADKGSSVGLMIERYRPGAAVYFGDDTTDLSVFRALDKASGKGCRTVKVAVASKEAPRELLEEADIVVESDRAVRGILAWLAS